MAGTCFVCLIRPSGLAPSAPVISTPVPARPESSMNRFLIVEQCCGCVSAVRVPDGEGGNPICEKKSEKNPFFAPGKNRRKQVTLPFKRTSNP